MTPQLLALLLANLAGAALVAVLGRALGDRCTRQRRRLLPVFITSALAGFFVLILNLVQLQALVWVGAAICGYAAQRNAAARD